MSTKHGKVHTQIVEHIRSGIYLPNKRLPGERDLARQFDVSVGTVVRALDELTRAGWLERRRGSGTYVRLEQPVAASEIVFVVPYQTDITEHVYLSPLFGALCDVCYREGIPLKIGNIVEPEWALLPERFPQGAYYIVSPSITSEALLRELWLAKHPMVIVGASWNHPVSFPTVDSDNRDGARRGVEYLLNLGHRRIVLINGTEQDANCRDRALGYQDALQAWDGDVDERLIVWAGSNMTLNPVPRNRLADLLLSRQRPTALFCAGYFLALEAMDVARQLGLAIPEQLSVLAFDDTRSAQYLQPPLTTLRQPLRAIGQMGAEKLIAMMRTGHREESQHTRMPVELITRQSCATPK